MRTYLDCMPCFIRQTLDAGEHAGLDDAGRETLLRRVLRELSDMPLSESPPSMAARVHGLVRDITGDPDPYRRIKDRSNERALGLLPDLQREMRDAEDPLDFAVRLAIAGNIIDFGAMSTVDDDVVHATLECARTADLPREGMDCFMRKARSAVTVLYIGDNAGEAVFDRLLLDALPAARTIYAVRGGPVINDVTLEDAHGAGIREVADIIDSGHAAPGILLEESSPGFLREFDGADMVIAKGQGNYESLSACGREVSFLLMAKCPVIARDIGCDVGSFVILNDGMGDR